MRLPLSLAGAVIGASLLATPPMAAPLAGALSQDLSSQTQAGDSNSSVIQVQSVPLSSGGGGYVRGGRYSGSRHGGSRYGGSRHGGNWHGDRGDDGAAAAGLLGGLFLGAIIAGEAQRNQGIDYCIRRYRSYDPNSMTYLGNDGRRHRCP